MENPLLRDRAKAPKRILDSNETMKGIVSGVDKLYSAVSSTLGPSGNTVLYTTPVGNHVATKDGVSVAKQIHLSDETEDRGVQMVKEVAIMANDIVGDGTTSSIVLAHALLNNSIEYIDKNISRVELKNELTRYVDVIVEHLASKSLKINRSDKQKISDIAKISANNDEEVGSLVAEAIVQAGDNVGIAIENAINPDSFVETIEGMYLSSPVHTPFIINERDLNRVKHKNARVLVTMDDFSSELVLAEIDNAFPNEPLVVFAKSFSERVMGVIVKGHASGTAKIIPIIIPGFGSVQNDTSEDIAIYTDAVLFSEIRGTGMDKFKVEALGFVDQITSTLDDTIIVSNKKGEGYYAQLKHLKNISENEKQSYYKDNYKRRLSMLSGGVTTIYVGARSELEQKELRDRIEDALSACKASLEEGIHEGGGVALLRASEHILNMPLPANASKERKYAIEILAESIRAPFRKIITNTNNKYELIEEKIIEKGTGHGYNAKTKKYVNMLNDGIVDPVKVTRISLEKANSVIGTILTVNNSLITE